MKPEDVFYSSRVRITKGFYKGHLGIVKDHHRKYLLFGPMVYEVYILGIPRNMTADHFELEERNGK